MPAYLIAEITIHDRKEYEKYEAGFLGVFSQYDGRVLASDEAAECIEGEWAATRSVLLKFPDKAAAKAWLYSDAYQEICKHRYAASVTHSIMVEGFE